MIINASNQAAAEHDIYVHDSEIKSMDIDYANDTLTIVLDNLYLQKNFRFRFEGLVYFEMNAMKLWNGGFYGTHGIGMDEILDFLIMGAEERNEKLNQLIAHRDEVGYDNISYNKPESDYYRDNLIFCAFEFSSGDRFEFVCKTIEFDSSELVSK